MRSGPVTPNVNGYCGDTRNLEWEESCDVFRYTGCAYFEAENIDQLTDIWYESDCQLACRELAWPENCLHYQYNQHEGTCLLYGHDYASYCTQLAGIPNKPVNECIRNLPFKPMITKAA